ncbi:MAG: hypothetical protein HY013_12885 [Candidatus Solibacter usitatus]|nr:hypothetical protein [Candidatus Solibacter usitatus]
MDTRSKIIDAGRLAELPGPCTLVAGYFDVLLTDHVRNLRQLRRPGYELVVVLRDPPDSLLEPRARAELAAALDMVDYVVLGADGQLPVDATLEEDRQALIEHVIERH